MDGGKDTRAIDGCGLPLKVKHHRLAKGGEHDGRHGTGQITEDRHDHHQPLLECRRTVSAGRFTIGSGLDWE